MKKNIFSAIIIVMAVTVFVAGCKKETATNNNSTPTDTIPPTDTIVESMPKVAQVRHVYYDITHKYTNAALEELVSSDTTITTTIERWTWDGDQLTSIEYIRNNESAYTVSYAHEGSIMTMTRSDRPNETNRFVFADDELDTLQVFTNSMKTKEFCFVRNGNNVEVTATTWSQGSQSGTIIYNLTFGNGDILTSSNESYGSATTYTYTYGTVLNPYYLTDASLSYLNLSRHIALTEDKHYVDSYGTDKNEHKEFVYTLNGDRIQSMRSETGSVVGKYVNAYIHLYEYTYLSN